MKTEYFRVSDNKSESVEIMAAAEIINSGGLVAIPTETVYGLGASALNEKAVSRIFEVKGRPQDNPLIIHVSGKSELEKWCKGVPAIAYRLADKYWPGPLTVILKRSDTVPDIVTAGMDSVAVRCPDHALTLSLIEKAGVPIAAPSANISGKPSPTCAEHVLHDLDGRIEAILDGGPCRVGLESTIIDLTVTPPRLLRPGGISLEELEDVIGEVSIDSAVYRRLNEGEQPKAPGMKYRHYSPEASVIILDGEFEKVSEYVKDNYESGTAVLCFDGEEKYFKADICLSYGNYNKPETLAEKLFSCLRELDRSDIKKIFARCPPKNGVGLAVYNRLSKAAGYTVIEVEK